jgi:hypothetical protein
MSVLHLEVGHGVVMVMGNTTNMLAAVSGGLCRQWFSAWLYLQDWLRIIGRAE